MAYRFGAALRSFWQVRGYFREGRTFLEQVLAHSDGSLPSWHAKALNDAVLLAISQADYVWGEALCQENLVRCRELGDGAAVARTLYLLGWLALLKGNLATAHPEAFGEPGALSRSGRYWWKPHVALLDGGGGHQPGRVYQGTGSV